MAKDKKDTEVKVRPKVQIVTPKRKFTVGGFDVGWSSLRSAGRTDGWPVRSEVVGWERIEKEKK
jgi:hypothetical protein